MKIQNQILLFFSLINFIHQIYSATCPWKYKSAHYDLPIKMMAFDEYRNSEEQAIQIKDTFGTSILSSMFIDRNKFPKFIDNTSPIEDPHNYHINGYDYDTDPYYNSDILRIDDRSGQLISDTWIQYLDLSSNKFEKILPKTFDTISHCLQYLLLNNNSISEIDGNIFDNLKELHYLDVSNNKLKSINLIQLFNYLSLDYLNISYNEIEEINGGLDVNVSQLPFKTMRIIDFSHNRLHKYFNNKFPFRVIFLNLSYNMIEEFKITDDLHLYDINLSHNKIKYFDCNNLKNVSNLIQLNISFNRISTFKCSNMFKLQLIDLTANKLTHLHSDTFKNLNALTHLDLSNNKIILKSNIFKMLPTLKYLNLKNNNLKTIPVRTFSGLDNLISLILFGNQLKYFQFGSFSGLYNLNELDLSNNQISDSIQLNKLMELDNLRTLLLDGNLMTEFYLIDLNFKLSKLSEISLNNMPWSCDSLVQIIIELRKINVTLKTIPYSNNEFDNSISGIKCSINYDDFNENFEQLMLQDHMNLVDDITTDISVENPIQSTELNILNNENTIQTVEINTDKEMVNINDDKNTSLSVSSLSILLERIENIIKNETVEIKDDLLELKNITTLIKDKIYDNTLQNI